LDGGELNYKAENSLCYGEKWEVIVDGKETKLSDEEVLVNCVKYGRLYNWEVAIKACPSGWHLPTNEEWGVLTKTVGGDSGDKIAGKYLKAASGWKNNHRGNSGNGEDKFGFSALPGGVEVRSSYTYSDGSSTHTFGKLGSEGGWWTASEYKIDNKAFYRRMHIGDRGGNNEIYVGYTDKDGWYSVRCLQGPAPAQTKKTPNVQTSIVQQKGTFTDTRDGKTYKTVKIGELVWMGENLNYEASGSKCYNDSTAYCKKYGRLYNLETAMKACPVGWHLSSNDEWAELAEAVGGREIAGKYLKATSGWNDYKGKSGNGTDAYGFSALPGGSGYLDGKFYDVGYIGYWLNAKENDNGFDHNKDIGGRYELGYGSGGGTLQSVRCVQGASAQTEKKPIVQTASAGTFTDTRDGKVYKTTKIGEQVWFAENLNYEAEDSKCYDNKPANCKIYGKLYDWKTAMKACPNGWHLPSNEEWKVLTRAVGGKKIAGKYLKATGGWRDAYGGKPGNGTDNFGFSALPGGVGTSDNHFGNGGNFGFWWSATNQYYEGGAYAYKMWIQYESESARNDDETADKTTLYSVRCLQNATPPKGSAK